MRLTLALSLLAVPFSSYAADLQSVIQRLEAAEAQIQQAQTQVSTAKHELYQLLQNPGPGYVCVYNYFGKQYQGRGATQAEAVENAIFDCSRDRNNANPGDCRYWSNKNGNTQCRTTN